MVGEELVSTSPDILSEIITQLGSIGLWLQTIGVVILIWIVAQVVNWVYNLKRMKRLNQLESKVESMEKKLDKVLKK